MTLPLDFVPEDGALYFVPLGGVGEFGANLSLYGYNDQWLMLDCGMGFSDETVPGIEVLLPDPTFIAEQAEKLVALVLTHAHLDHIGAVAHLWPQLRCPVYATKFTANVLRPKLQEAGILDEVPLHEIKLPGRFSLGAFDIELVEVTHSIPEPALVVIRTKAGAVVHTGDWKLDAGPVIGPLTDEKRLREIGGEGILALIGDSTNAQVEGVSGSEADLTTQFEKLFPRFQNRIVISCFSSNVARLESIARAAQACGRSVALVGRSLWTIYEAAQNAGYLKNLLPFVNDNRAAGLPRDKVVLVCTGSQGEPRAALTRIAHGDHPVIDLDEGDTVIFSARPIPGNERAITRLQNHLQARGIELVTSDDEFVHVSGHPAREEIVRLYQWLRPPVVIPVHGERPHLLAHAELARECQVPQTIIPENGTIIRLGPGRAAPVARAEVGVLAVDGNRTVPVDSKIITQRHRLVEQGAVVMALVLDHKGRLLARPRLSSFALADISDDEIVRSAEQAVSHTVQHLDLDDLRDDEAVRDAVRLTVRRHFTASLGKRPIVDVQLIRVGN
jgi:ribonuclease J